MKKRGIIEKAVLCFSSVFVVLQRSMEVDRSKIRRVVLKENYPWMEKRLCLFGLRTWVRNFSSFEKHQHLAGIQLLTEISQGQNLLLFWTDMAIFIDVPNQFSSIAASNALFKNSTCRSVSGSMREPLLFI